MSYPTIELDEKKVILLSGFETTQTTNTPYAITPREKLEEAPKRHRDAVAFAYVSGEWVPAA